MSRRGLGRGLDALLPSRDDDDRMETREGMKFASVTDIRANPNQPREEFEEATLTELAASIRELGVLQPLLVREVENGFELIAGERRLRASKMAGLSQVPVMIVETDDRGSLERALVENIHRADLNPIEEAAAYKQLIDDAGITQDELGRRLGRNRVTVTNSLRLLELATDVQRLLVERKITAAHGKSLLGLQGNPFQMRVARRVAEEKLSVRETDALVRRFQEMSATSTTTKPAASAEMTEAQRTLSDHLQTRVRVEMGKRKGKIVLDFVSLDELDRLMRIITGETRGARTSTTSPESR